MSELVNFCDQLENLKKLNEYIDQEVVKRIGSIPDDPYRSELINELTESLAAAQSEYPCIKFNRVNASWSDEYSDLDIVLKHIMPLLSKNKLAFDQYTKHTESSETMLHTRLAHASGQWKESRIKISPTHNDMKTFDSTLANYRRHQAIILLGITMKDDPKDDDGAIEKSVDYKKIVKNSKTNYQRTKESYESITKEQLEELCYELEGYDQIGEDLLTKFELRALADLPKTKFKFAVEKIRRFKDALKGRSLD